MPNITKDNGIIFNQLQEACKIRPVPRSALVTRIGKNCGPPLAKGA